MAMPSTAMVAAASGVDDDDDDDDDDRLMVQEKWARPWRVPRRSRWTWTGWSTGMGCRNVRVWET